jgi:hypothetical protein
VFDRCAVYWVCVWFAAWKPERGLTSELLSGVLKPSSLILESNFWDESDRSPLDALAVNVGEVAPTRGVLFGEPFD